MPLIINGLNIPETLGNVKVNGSNMTTVNINGSTVWQVSTSITTYIIQNGIFLKHIQQNYHLL